MAIYFNRQLVSPIFLKTIEKTITINTNGTLTTSYNTNVNYGVDDINSILSNLETNTYETWTRPSGWPNLDSITMASDFEGVYLTFDNNANLPYYIASFHCLVTNSGQYVVDIGYLNNGTFTVLLTSTVAQNAYLRIDYSGINHTTYPYVVIRLTPAVATNHFTRCLFGSIPKATTGTPVDTYSYYNFCLERRGLLPWVNIVVNDSTNRTWCTMYMQKDATIIGTQNPITGTNFAAAWWMGGNLKEVDFTGWDTSNWTITSISSLFANCYNIQKLDLRAFDTHKWAITTLASAFSYCYFLHDLDVSTWNTTNWRVTTLENTWNGCYRIETINLDNWDTSLWAVTTLASTWANCLQLRVLNIGYWVTNNWRVTSLASTWNGCRFLVTLPVETWNTSLWAVTSLASTWYNMRNIDSFDFLSNWDTSNWAVTSLASTWSGCQKAVSIGISNWDTHKWKVTTLGSTWANCYALVHLNLNNWNTSQFAVTTMASTWSGCTALIELGVKDWNVSGFKVTTFASTFLSCNRLREIEVFLWYLPTAVTTTINGMFAYCYSLKKIDFSKWTCTTWALTDIANFARECRDLLEIHMSNIDVSTITTANNYGSTSSTGANTFIAGCHSLVKFDPPTGWRGRIYLHLNYSLPRAEIVKFFNNLVNPPLTAALYINVTRHRLTTADIAIATEKGYTIS